MTVLRRLPGLSRDALLYELSLYRSIVRWLVRRPDVPRGAEPIGYSRLVAPMLWVWILGGAVEVIVIEVVLRHLDQSWAHALRAPLLVLGIWGVVWMLGLLASYRMRPHLVTDAELHVRNGARTWLVLPLGSVEATRPVEHELPGVIRSLHFDEGLALVGISSRTNLEMILTGLTIVSTSKGDVTVSRVGIWVDEPREVAAQIRFLLGTRR
ncbi:MAG: hypothetical protein AVDCRST_MAG72-1253 [uncultured Nocardioidaceae bacterium]|uniref:Bacterial Pleckstrin homology domain-containing protein n=1 Tax=uncultured Nocardioidaceae bacterium TaxID=253824 RepID=A0A6J4M419_9ACTN|nr:MAG: hypothetical protein AVDCRST_MAG72-1253 [uncultured Nocardioidaceae bacterium]